MLSLLQKQRRPGCIANHPSACLSRYVGVSVGVGALSGFLRNCDFIVKVRITETHGNTRKCTNALYLYAHTR